MANLDISVLEGWLIKKKTKEHGLKLFGSDTRRWFKMQKLKSQVVYMLMNLCNLDIGWTRRTCLVLLQIRQTHERSQGLDLYQ